MVYELAHEVQKGTSAFFRHVCKMEVCTHEKLENKVIKNRDKREEVVLIHQYQIFIL